MKLHVPCFLCVYSGLWSLNDHLYPILFTYFKLVNMYRIWPNKGPGAYCFQRVQPPGPYLNPAVIWAPALNDFVASNTQKLPFFFINRQAIRHHANTKVYHIFFLLICDFHVIKFIHSSTHNHSKLNLFIHHNYIITRLSHNLHV